MNSTSLTQQKKFSQFDPSGDWAAFFIRTWLAIAITATTGFLVPDIFGSNLPLGPGHVQLAIVFFAACSVGWILDGFFEFISRGEESVTYLKGIARIMAGGVLFLVPTNVFAMAGYPSSVMFFLGIGFSFMWMLGQHITLSRDSGLGLKRTLIWTGLLWTGFISSIYIGILS